MWIKKHFIYLKGKFVIFLKGFNFRTGVIVTLLCIPFYILSFAQILLPISVAAKGILWVIFFGMAKIVQYSGLAILGVEGIKRLKGYLSSLVGKEK
ncbi:MAG: hypothetical protein RR341_03420 [Bacteroidales bacterium]